MTVGGRTKCVRQHVRHSQTNTLKNSELLQGFITLKQYEIRF